MTYVTDQTSQELRIHMRRLQKMPGWHEPLADRLYKEILDQEAEIERLRTAIARYLESQDAMDNNEYQSMPEDFGRLNGRRKAARDDLDAALSGEPNG